ncbi:MAG: hypothetical protein OEY09_18735 [Gammaproteobacteria bacterium]|nr:hypothetical protein [Gammaproteobacteria bacterium]
MNGYPVLFGFQKIVVYSSYTFLYDHLGGRKALPGSWGVDLRKPHR